MTDTPIVRRGSITQQEWEERRARYKQAVEAHPGVDSTFACMLENANRFALQSEHDRPNEQSGE